MTEPAEHAARRNFSIAVDFDGVIHEYVSPWIDAETIPDPPVPGAIEWLNEMREKFRIVVFTTRGKTETGRIAVATWLVARGYPAVPDDVTAEKPPALIYLDDRAVRFDGTNFPTADQIHRDFVPWNKRKKR